jgi:hypothetical protein
VEAYKPTALQGVNAKFKCRRCNRALKDPISVEAGIGPTCAKKELEGPTRHPVMPLDPFDQETMDIMTRRKVHVPIFNIGQVHRHHSPAGMEFAYGGSGPADFAINILALFVASEGEDGVKLWDGSYVHPDVWSMHQEFKRDFIEPMSFYGGLIEGSTIRQWIDERRGRSAL